MPYSFARPLQAGVDCKLHKKFVKVSEVCQKCNYFQQLSRHNIYCNFQGE